MEDIDLAGEVETFMLKTARKLGANSGGKVIDAVLEEVAKAFDSIGSIMPPHDKDFYGKFADEVRDLKLRR